MFWPKDHMFNCFKQLMLFGWMGSGVSLIISIIYQQQLDNLSCGNQTDFQLLNHIMCESTRNRVKEFTISKEQCYVNGLCFILNISIVVSMLIDWFKIKFLRKWFSFDYLLNVIYLVAFHFWIYLNEIEFQVTVYYYTYLGLILFQSFITLIFEYKYYNRYLNYLTDFILEDPMFDPKIISYSSIKIVYMCGFLTTNKYPQSKWAALAYQLYKHLLICIAQLSIMLIIWYFIGLDCNHIVYGERIILLLSIILFFTLIVFWKRDTKSAKLTYIFLSCIFFILIINLLQKVINSTDQLYNLSIYLSVMIGVMLTSILALKFLRSFKEHRAYSELFDKEFRKLLFQVYEQCRNKEYFMLKYNFKIKYKCCVCGTLAVDLVCNQCYAAVFNPKK